MANKEIHELKILPEYYDLIEKKIKNFEVRYNDRNFNIGDILYLEEFNLNGYTGRKLIREIKYILNDDNYCKKGFVILQI
ncbi:MAG: DUF3850 domain-containing protein [Sedimentibacter sp.]|uniref:DUF3850 domain-containing protein n=1 Tax=Sedimentibacter sp. TaxID=1960295 RepID=UPI0029828738|nr:DUF3850 domain-containing protein [Sedimentibacter sp.]MDW5300680.1 DUF3850 domain-containing protein [Sedimentibacter sp.]